MKIERISIDRMVQRIFPPLALREAPRLEGMPDLSRDGDVCFAGQPNQSRITA